MTKPDLVALADEPLTPIERVRLSLAMSDAGYSFDPGIDDVIELLEAYDRLASQPSSYEAGLRDMRERAALVASGFDAACNSKRMQPFVEAGLVATVCQRDHDIAAAIAALPADGVDEAHDYLTRLNRGAWRDGINDIQSSDGGVEARHANRQSTETSGSSVVKSTSTAAGVAPGPSEATPSTAGLVREAALADYNYALGGLAVLAAIGCDETGKMTGDHVALTQSMERRREESLAALSAPVEAPVAVKPRPERRFEIARIIVAEYEIPSHLELNATPIYHQDAWKKALRVADALQLGGSAR